MLLFPFLFIWRCSIYFPHFLVDLTKAQLGYQQRWSATDVPFLCPLSIIIKTFHHRSENISTKHRLCFSGWSESESRYCILCVGFQSVCHSQCSDFRPPACYSLHHLCRCRDEGVLDRLKWQSLPDGRRNVLENKWNFQLPWFKPFRVIPTWMTEPTPAKCKGASLSST